MSGTDGRTWTVTGLDWRGAGAEATWDVVAGGGALHAAAAGPLGDGDYGILAIFRSDDGGRHWTKTRDRMPHSTRGDLVAAADGTLLVNSRDGAVTMLSRDGGRTFTDVEPRVHGFTCWTRTGYVATSEPSDPIMYSTDGLHRRDLHLGS